MKRYLITILLSGMTGLLAATPVAAACKCESCKCCKCETCECTECKCCKCAE